MDEPLVQKTESGRQALQRRGAELDPRTRQLLVLCNGRTPMADLRTLFGAPADVLLQGLIARGLVERVVPAVAVAPAPPTEPPPPVAEPLDLPAARARAVALLERLFGPGGGDLGLAMQRAHDKELFEKALQGVQEVLQIYQGRKRAAVLVEQIRRGP